MKNSNNNNTNKDKFHFNIMKTKIIIVQKKDHKLVLIKRPKNINKI